jgi:predicted transcriptional regulator of viral defense system
MGETVLARQGLHIGKTVGPAPLRCPVGAELALRRPSGPSRTDGLGDVRSSISPRFRKFTALNNKCRVFLKIMDLRALFSERGWVLTARELEEAGVTYYMLRPYLASGDVLRIKQGVYKWDTPEVDEWVEASKLVSRGCFCLFSAAQIHGLSTFVSSEYHLAVPRKTKVILPDQPAIRLYYWQDRPYELGRSPWFRGEQPLPVYDREKTVCDFVKYRYKLGWETTREVLQHYLDRRDRNLDQLMRYAAALRLHNVLEPLLTAMV